MKARVKATGEIGIVANIDLLFGNKGNRYQSDEVEIIDSYAEVDTDNDTEPDYWEKLKHQYAGMAMQAYITRHDDDRFYIDDLANDAVNFATALVEKLKEDK